MKTLLLAEYLAPMDRAIVRAGAVVFAGGRIIDVGAAKEVQGRYPDAEVVEAGQSLVMPGLVNAHVHLELSDQTAGDRWTGTFVEWLEERVRARAGVGTDELPAVIERATRNGAEQCIEYGVTTVGDITRFAEVTRPVIAEAGLAGPSFGEVVAMGKRAATAAALVTAAIAGTAAGGRLRVGVSPHAPYTVTPEAYRDCLRMAAARECPLATHLAESPDEAEFLARHTGPFRRLWNSLGLWEEGAERFEGGPVRFAAWLGLLEIPAVLAHVNYCDDEELEVLARGRASVVYCPRTHAYFGHPPHRWREMLARGITVALGTDSCASSPDLNLVDDLRLAHRLVPDVEAGELWKLVTVNGARALGVEERVGSLAVGKEADAVVFPVATDDPLREVLERQTIPAQVWVAGSRRR